MKALLDIATPDTATHLVIPDSALTRCSEPFFAPFDGVWHAVVLRGVVIDRLGKHIAPTFAPRYYNRYITAVHPFAPEVEALIDSTSVARDCALIVSPPANADSDTIPPDTAGLIDALVSLYSEQSTLKTGDLVLTTDYITVLPDAPANVQIAAKGPFPAMRLKIR